MFSEVTLQISVYPLLSRLPWWHANRKCSWFFSLDRIFALSIKCALTWAWLLKQTNKQFEKNLDSVALTDGKLTCLIINLWKSLANTFLLDCLCLLEIELKLGLQLNVWKLIGFTELKEGGKQHSMHQFWTSSYTFNISKFCWTWKFFLFVKALISFLWGRSKQLAKVGK